MSHPSDPGLPPDLRRRLAAARAVVAFTGAGVSKESGLDTFRDAGGVWQRVRPEEVATPQAFRRDPAFVWRWYAERFRRAAAAEPNPAHRSLARWERLFPSFRLVTQNVDGLHQRAGSTDPLELHGSLLWARCDGCGRRRPMAEALAASPDAPPACTCRGRMRPAVVWFGESLPQAVLDLATEAAAWCEVFVSVGTSGTVYPAAGLIEVALANGASLVEVNPEPTPFAPRRAAPRRAGGGGRPLADRGDRAMPPVDLMIRELPETERPRERLLSQGSAALSDAELVAVLLRTGSVGRSASQMAMELLQDVEGLPGLLGLGALSLRRHGLGPAKVATLLAAIELGRRLARDELPRRSPLARPSDIVRYVALRYHRRDQEVMGALFVDARNRLLGDCEVFRGTLHRAAVEPREVLKECLLRGAAGVVLFHTHPSGDPSPSADDLLFTRRMEAAADVVGVRLVDHLVVGGAGRWRSLLRKAAW